MRIGIAVKPGLMAAREQLVELEAWLRTRGVDAVWSTEAAKLFTSGSRTVVDRTEIPKQSDLVVVLGGDGTLLGMAKAIAESGHDVPILGVNFGSLGFLTEITRPEIFTAIDAVTADRASYDLRMMLRAVATLASPPPLAERASARSRRSAFGAKAEQPAVSHMALNDVVFSRTALSRIIELEVSVGDQLMTAVKADGLIVATPTGSTAYNLAAGGPIVHPAMDALLLTPIAPHTLTNRPIVIPSEREVRVRSTSSNAGDEVYVTVDGQTGFGMHEGDEIAITRAERPLRLVRSITRSYFEVLRQKLKWNER
jgi:NAD+ kinase